MRRQRALPFVATSPTSPSSSCATDFHIIYNFIGSIYFYYNYIIDSLILVILWHDDDDVQAKVGRRPVTLRSLSLSVALALSLSVGSGAVRLRVLATRLRDREKPPHPFATTTITTTCITTSIAMYCCNMAILRSNTTVVIGNCTTTCVNGDCSRIGCCFIYLPHVLLSHRLQCCKYTFPSSPIRMILYQK